MTIWISNSYPIRPGISHAMPARRSRGAVVVTTTSGSETSTAPCNISSVPQVWEESDEYNSRRTQLESITKERTGFFPKPAQTRLAMALAMGQDVTCIAPTGFGKSLAFQMAVFGIQMRNKPGKKTQFGICIPGIEALVEDQVEQCTQIGINAVKLTDRALQKVPGILKAIANGQYDLCKFTCWFTCEVLKPCLTSTLSVYLAPEKLMAKNSPFQLLLQAPEAKNHERIAFLVCNECHLVEDW